MYVLLHSDAHRLGLSIMPLVSLQQHYQTHHLSELTLPQTPLQVGEYRRYRHQLLMDAGFQHPLQYRKSQTGKLVHLIHL